MRGRSRPCCHLQVEHSCCSVSASSIIRPYFIMYLYLTYWSLIYRLVHSVAFSPDGRHIVSGSHDQTIRVWNAMTGETMEGPFNGHTGSVNSVAFLPDGHYIVSGSGDRTIRVWNAMTGETVAGPLTGHADWVYSVAFSPDGRHIVLGSADRIICVWNAATGETVAGSFFHRTRLFGQLCGVLARWSAHCLRFSRSNYSCVECHDGRGACLLFLSVCLLSADPSS
jgi:WD40 repeat protein